jgi:hypothetical protein
LTSHGNSGDFNFLTADVLAWPAVRAMIILQKLLIFTGSPNPCLKYMAIFALTAACIFSIGDQPIKRFCFYI